MKTRELKNRPYSARNEKGFVTVIIMMGISLIFIFALISNGLQKRQMQVHSESKLSVDILQQNFMNYVQDDEAWRKTVSDSRNSSSLSCLTNGTLCDSTTKVIAVLKNANDEVVIDTASGMGVTNSGSVCEINQGNSSGCNLRINLSWEPLCGGGCIDPQLIRIKISIENIGAENNNSGRFIASTVIGLEGVRSANPMPVASQVTVGFGRTCALAEGAVYCWGAWTGSNTPVKVPGLTSGVTQVVAGTNDVCAIKSGNVYCWGANNASQSGYFPGWILPLFVPMSSPNLVYDQFNIPLSNVMQVSVGLETSCAITSNGAAYCWGSNGGGLIGYNEVAGILYGDDDSMISRGKAHPVLDLSRGANGVDLGPVTSISVGTHHACAVVNGAVMCWGSNDQRGGVLNICSTGLPVLGYDPNGPKGYKLSWPNINTGTVLPGIDPRYPADPDFWNTSENPGAYNGHFSTCGTVTDFNRGMKMNARPQLTDNPDLASNVKQVVVSGISSCALKTTGQLYCWGKNWGALPLDPSGTFPWVGSGNAIAYPVEVTSITGVESLSRIASHFCALKAGKLFCWGSANSYNALGNPAGFIDMVSWQPTELTGLPPNISYHYGGSTDQGEHNCAVASGKVYCWGRNNDGQLGDGTTTDKTMGIPTMVRKWQ